jgi:hypothetical protein
MHGSHRNIKIGILILIFTFFIFLLLRLIFSATIDTPLGEGNTKSEKAFTDLKERLAVTHPEVNAQMALAKCQIRAMKKQNEAETLREFMFNCWNDQIVNAEIRLKSTQDEQNKYTEAAPLLNQVLLENPALELTKDSNHFSTNIVVIHGIIKNNSKYLLSSAIFSIKLYVNNKDLVVATTDAPFNFESQGGLKPGENREVSIQLSKMFGGRNWQTLEIQGATVHKLITRTKELRDSGNRQLIPEDYSKEVINRKKNIEILKINADMYKNL